MVRSILPSMEISSLTVAQIDLDLRWESCPLIARSTVVICRDRYLLMVGANLFFIREFGVALPTSAARVFSDRRLRPRSEGARRSGPWRSPDRVLSCLSWRPSSWWPPSGQAPTRHSWSCTRRLIFSVSSRGWSRSPSQLMFTTRDLRKSAFCFAKTIFPLWWPWIYRVCCWIWWARALVWGRDLFACWDFDSFGRTYACSRRWLRRFALDFSACLCWISIYGDYNGFPLWIGAILRFNGGILILFMLRAVWIPLIVTLAWWVSVFPKSFASVEWHRFVMLPDLIFFSSSHLSIYSHSIFLCCFPLFLLLFVSISQPSV